MKKIEKFLSPGLLALLRGVVCSFAGAVLLGVINYLIRRILVQNLSQTDFGFFYSMFALFTLLTTFSQFGVQQAAPILTARFFAEKQEKRIDILFSELLFFSSLAGCVLMCILFFSSSILAERFFKYPEAKSAVAVFSPFVLLYPLWLILQSLPHGKRNFSFYNAMNIIQMFCILLGVCFAVRHGVFAVCSAWTAIFAAVLAAGFAVILRRYRLRLSFRAVFCRKIFQQIWKLCSWMSGSLAGIILLSNLDTFCLTWFSNLQNVAAYNIAQPIMQILQTLMVLPLVFLPVAVDLWQKKKYTEIRRIFLLTNLLLLFGSIPLAAVMHYAGKWVITILFGAQFTGSAPALTIMSGGILFYVAGQFNLNLLNSIGEQKNGMFLIMGTIALDLFLNVLLIPSRGFIGAAIALSSAYLLLAASTFSRAAWRLRNAGSPAQL